MAKGRKCSYRPAETHEVHQHLLTTFFGDVKGFLNATNRDEKAEKLADLHEVVEQLMEYYDIPVDRVHMIKTKKRQELWGFDQKIILEEEVMILD